VGDVERIDAARKRPDRERRRHPVQAEGEERAHQRRGQHGRERVHPSQRLRRPVCLEGLAGDRSEAATAAEERHRPRGLAGLLPDIPEQEHCKGLAERKHDQPGREADDADPTQGAIEGGLEALALLGDAREGRKEDVARGRQEREERRRGEPERVPVLAQGCGAQEPPEPNRVGLVSHPLDHRRDENVAPVADQFLPHPVRGLTGVWAPPAERPREEELDRRCRVLPDYESPDAKPLRAGDHRRYAEREGRCRLDHRSSHEPKFPLHQGGRDEVQDAQPNQSRHHRGHLADPVAAEELADEGRERECDEREEDPREERRDHGRVGRLLDAVAPLDESREHARVGDKQPDADQDRPRRKLAEVRWRREPRESEVEGERDRLGAEVAEAGDSHATENGPSEAGWSLWFAHRTGRG
jgi:hypothetical protein